VVEHVGFRCNDRFECADFAQEIRGQDFDRRSGACRADGRNGSREVRSTSVGKVVAIDRGDDHMLQSQLGDCFGDLDRLIGVERTRQAGAHVTEGTGACRYRP
jgi:hypothetical protein